ncbi:MAG: mannose-1-phosphate guanylyltransferase [Candidatus Acetothermia bacterium]
MEDYTIYAVIMAGGRGRRLWPLSTPERPKQFIGVNGKSLLARTYERIRPLIEKENVLVVTNKGKGELVNSQLPELPERNVIEEPMGRNTAPCIGLSAIYSEEYLGLDRENSVMVVLPADHLVGREERFREILMKGAEVAGTGGELVTLGIEPTRAATGYGYIEAGEELQGFEPARRVLSFTEKPDSRRAEKFLAAGNYYWNSGTFVWRTDKLLEGLEEYMPELFGGLKNIKDAVGGEEEGDVLREEYKRLSGTSIDYGLMEKAKNRAVLPASVEWSDLGDWPSFASLLERDPEDNASEGEVTFRDSSGSLVYEETGKPTVAIGLSDTVVVNTPEALLVMDKGEAQKVKEVAREFEED